MNDDTITNRAIEWRDQMNHSEDVKSAASQLSEGLVFYVRDVWKEVKASGVMSQSDFWEATRLALAMTLKVMGDMGTPPDRGNE